jgi:hypothetical protein
LNKKQKTKNPLGTFQPAEDPTTTTSEAIKQNQQTNPGPNPQTPTPELLHRNSYPSLSPTEPSTTNNDNANDRRPSLIHFHTTTQRFPLRPHQHPPHYARALGKPPLGPRTDCPIDLLLHGFQQDLPAGWGPAELRQASVVQAREPDLLFFACGCVSLDLGLGDFFLDDTSHRGEGCGRDIHGLESFLCFPIDLLAVCCMPRNQDVACTFSSEQRPKTLFESIVFMKPT